MAKIFHGGRLDAAIEQYGGERKDWLDLSTGINPHAYPVGEISHEAWQRLPDDSAQAQLYSLAREYYKVPKDMALVSGNGTQALIQNLPPILEGRTVGIVSPTYEEHAHCWEGAGRDVVRIATLEECVERCDIVVVVNPNNPTGSQYTVQALAKASKQLSQKFGYLIVDEAFGDIFPELSIVPVMNENVIVLRSFGKFFGLAGLRLGFAIAASNIADQLSQRLGPWSVSGPALETGSAAFSDVYWIENARAQIKQNSEDQAGVIEACGFQLIGNGGLFMEFDHENAAHIHEALLKEHILVRPFPERSTRLRFGLCKCMQDLERLAWVLKKHA